MRPLGSVLLPLFTLALLGACASPKPAPDPRWDPAIAAADQIAADLQRQEGMPGLSVAVVVDGEVDWAAAYGLADVAAGRAATPETRFRLASVSKVFTAAAAVKLVEAGRLNVDAPISRYVRDLPEPLTTITARQLAAHLGGIRHYDRKDFWPQPIDNQHFDSVTASLTLFANDPLVAPPGTKYSYSTFGYTLLAAVLEGAAGQDYLGLLAKSVARPLALDSLVADQRDAPIGERTSFYDRDAEGRAVPASPIDPSYKWAGGGLLATARDVARFGAAHFEAGFFTASGLALLFTPVSTVNGDATGYGFGWRVGQDPTTGLDIVHHAGAQTGARAFLLVYREPRVAVAVLSNQSSVPEDPAVVARAIAQPFLQVRGAGARQPGR